MSQLQSNTLINYPINEPTSVLTFNSLVTEVAIKLGTSYYGSTDSGPAQPPINPYDLAEAQSIVNDGVRMFLSNGPPPNGWHFQKPLGYLDFWPIITADQYLYQQSWVSINSTYNQNPASTVVLTLNYSSTVVPSTIGASSTNAVPQFYPSMELRNIWIGGNPAPNTLGWFIPPNGSQSTLNSTIGIPFTICQYINPSTVAVFDSTGSTVANAISTLGSTGNAVWSMPCTGDYTLPADFSGQFAGEVCFIQNTNRGLVLKWIDEYAIRVRRSNYNFETGTPYECAVRMIPDQTILNNSYFPQRRRWEMCVWRISNEFLHVMFPYVRTFQNLVYPTDLPPTPMQFDEALKAACMAFAEYKQEDMMGGPSWQYYTNVALPNAYKLDFMSVNKNLGYCGDRGMYKTTTAEWLRQFREWDYQRPTVTYSGGTPQYGV
jgi:hypothetical protein